VTRLLCVGVFLGEHLLADSHCETGRTGETKLSKVSPIIGAAALLISLVALPASAGVFNVSKYGALPNDDRDDTMAVVAAIDACRQAPGSRLVFPKGRYHFAEGQNPASPRLSMAFSECRNLTIDGTGAVFVFRGLTNPMHFSKCRNVKVIGITIDWDRPPFSIGTVTAKGDKSFDVRVLDEFPVKGGEPVQAFMDYDPKTKLPRRHGLDVYHSVTRTELAGPQLLRVHLQNDVNIQPGSLAVLRHQVYAFNALYFDLCSNVTVENATVYTTPGMGLVAHRCDNINLDRFRVIPKPGTPRLMSATADATHFTACAGTIRMTRCEYRGMGDDAVNVGSLYVAVKEKVNDRTVIAGHPLKIPAPPEPGETMELSHADNLLVYGSGKVTTVEPQAADGLCRLTFAEPLPAELKPGDVLGNASRTAAVRISKCRIGNNRARGALIQTRDAIVEDCTFENCTSGGVWVLTEVVYFYEAIGTRKIVIRNNTFTNCNYGGPIGEASLAVYAYLADFKYPPLPGVHRDITLENNVINGADNCGIFVAGADGIAIRDNRIEGACAMPTREQGHACIYIMSSRNVEVTGNQVLPDKQGSGMKSVVTLGPECEKSTVRISDNKGS
jgi:parallel beta-helix repeat protein